MYNIGRQRMQPWSVYSTLRSLCRVLNICTLQEKLLRERQKSLLKALQLTSDALKSIQGVPLIVGQLHRLLNDNNAIVASTTGSHYFVSILSTLNHTLLQKSTPVLLHRHSHALVDVMNSADNSCVSLLMDSKKPDVSYTDIGGYDLQKQEIREAIELAITHNELFQQIGIEPPRGVLLYGPPGTGKTMMVMAVAKHSNAAFIQMVGSEFLQKYIGEGPRMVRDVFRTAKDNAPAIIFIDEVDSIATARFDASRASDREVQRILMELLNQLDGFEQLTHVKVVMATNRADTLDPALLRPGRLDRKIEFTYPDKRQKKLIFEACTNNMTLSPEIDLNEYAARPDKISAADVSAVCQEAGMHAVCNGRHLLFREDFEKAYKVVLGKNPA